MVMTQILHQKISQFFLKTSLAKIMVDVQTSLNGGSVKADFYYGENIDHPEKKKL